MTTGYSGKPAYKKLGLKDGFKIKIINEPADYMPFVGVPESASISVTRPEADLDYVHVFTRAREELEAILPQLKAAIQPAGVIWVSWPKKASRVPTDITEDTIRNLALDIGLVDIKVCAVDKVWSGLKLVIPVKDRPGGAGLANPTHFC